MGLEEAPRTVRAGVPAAAPAVDAVLAAGLCWPPDYAWQPCGRKHPQQQPNLCLGRVGRRQQQWAAAAAAAAAAVHRECMAFIGAMDRASLTQALAEQG